MLQLTTSPFTGEVASAPGSAIVRLTNVNGADDEALDPNGPCRGTPIVTGAALALAAVLRDANKPTAAQVKRRIVSPSIPR